MKRSLLLLTLLVSGTIFSQTEYFSTNGKDRLTKTEKDKMLEEMRVKLSKAFKKDMSVKTKIKETLKKEDSIIYQITFVIRDKSEKESNKKSYTQLENKEFPYFELQSLNGKPVKLNDLKGKPTLINFWFTKCAPCIDEIPILNKFYDKYKDKVNFISITYEKKEDVQSFLKKHPYKFKHLINSDKFIKKLEITSFPINIFIDKNGIVKKIESGIPYVLENEKPIIGDGKKFEELIKTMI